jgi:ribosome-associated toxin RatA of RatAB toxin-antitoxin module
MMRTVDERLVRAPVARIFELARDVERWPSLLPHYRFVHFRERTADGGGVVEMSANRPFAGGLVNWPTWWMSRMEIQWTGEKGVDRPAVRYRHIDGVTKGMEVAWTFVPRPDGVIRVRIVHTWTGPPWPLIGPFAATSVIGPVFVHGIASRTLAGLAEVAEHDTRAPTPEHGTETARLRGALV